MLQEKSLPDFATTVPAFLRPSRVPSHLKSSLKMFQLSQTPGKRWFQKYSFVWQLNRKQWDGRIPESSDHSACHFLLRGSFPRLVFLLNPILYFFRYNLVFLFNLTHSACHFFHRGFFPRLTFHRSEHRTIIWRRA